VPKKSKSSLRVQAAKNKIAGLLSAGVAFNPKGVSQSTRDKAASMLTRAGQQNQAGAIQAGVSGNVKVGRYR
jgi:hypothetical protein